MLAKLRNRRFFSLAELNAEIRDCVTTINAKVMRRIGKSRNELLETIDRPALNALPTRPYRYAEWKRARVAPDYHVEVADHYYSVPSKLIRETVEARITSATVEVFHKGQRVASHAFSAVRNRHTTITEHMPSAHRRYAEWTPQQMMREAAKIGPATDRAGRGGHESQAPSRAGLPIVPGHHAPGERPTAPSASRPRAGAATTSARPPTARSSRSCRTVSTKPTPTRKRRTARRSGTPTSVVVATTTDATDTAQPRG